MMSPRFNLNTMSLCRLAIVTTVMVTNAMATHFRGGTISWKPMGGHTVEFFFKMGWTFGSGPGCTEQKIGDFVDDPLLQGKTPQTEWLCTKGCPGKPVMHSASYYCMGANQQEQWEQGQMNFNYTFTNSGPFVAAFEGSAWMELGHGKGKGPWSISTTIDLRARSDTGKPNSSPVALSQTIYYMQYDCHHELRVPVLDPDGDQVSCQWAVGDECMAVCDGLPGATLNQQTCTITFDSTRAHLYEKGQLYGVALTIKDYPQTTIKLNGQEKKTPSDSLSSVPIQFLIKTPVFPVGCDEKPHFVSPTPAEGSEVIVHAGDPLSIVVAADNSQDTTKKIQIIDVIGPVDLHQSALTQDMSRVNTFQKELTWTTSEWNIGEHIVCARAVNERGKTGDPRCFTIKIVRDPCDNSPCLKGAACQSNKGTFTCLCVPGFSGKLCDLDIDDCSNPNPCQNGGTCHDLVNDFSCTCAPGFTDKSCSKDIDDCSNPNPCQNGGTCHDLVNDFSCTCAPGFTDKSCSKDIDDCSNPNPCQNGGTCHDQVNDFSCTCAPGFTDKSCSTDIDDCQPDPCNNGGVCHDMVNDYVCLCLPGYTGKSCSTDIDECSSHPCINGGNCSDEVNDFSCTCRSGFSGKNCHIGVDFCELKPCINGGACHNGFTGFTCQCVDGWQGKTCDYRSASSSSVRASCDQRKSGSVLDHGQTAKESLCCQATEYNDCQCFISPFTKPEVIEMDQATRDILCGLIGFPLGLGLSFLTFALFRWCTSLAWGTGVVQNYRGKHPPTKHCPRRTQNWVNEQRAPVEYPHKMNAPSLNRFSTAKPFYPRSDRSVKANSASVSLHTPPPSERGRGGGPVTPMNIYRASYNDDRMHSTGPKKYTNTYISGATDWNGF